MFAIFTSVSLSSLLTAQKSVISPSQTHNTNPRSKECHLFLLCHCGAASQQASKQTQEYGKEKRREAKRIEERKTTFSYSYFMFLWNFTIFFSSTSVFQLPFSWSCPCFYPEIWSKRDVSSQNSTLIPVAAVCSDSLTALVKFFHSLQHIDYPTVTRSAAFFMPFLWGIFFWLALFPPFPCWFQI